MRFILITMLLFSSGLIYGQSLKIDSFFSELNKKGKISGVILDYETNNEPLAFATIMVKNTFSTFTSDINGIFTIDLKSGVYDLIVSFIGYKPIEINNIEVTSNKTTICNQALAPLQINSVTSLASLN